MNENELHERYIRLAFQYESAIDALLARGLVDEEAADAAKERFYDTLNEESCGPLKRSGTITRPSACI